MKKRSMMMIKVQHTSDSEFLVLLGFFSPGGFLLNREIKRTSDGTEK
jgi:hypothetical protein